MLHLNKHTISFPRVLSSSREMVLSPVPSEEDELIQSIESSHGEVWQLDPTPDATELGEFWSGVQQDLHEDPDWFNFADDEK